MPGIDDTLVRLGLPRIAGVAVVALTMVLLLGSCHHKKERPDDRRDYRNEYVDDIYKDNGKSEKRGKSRLRKEAESWIGVPYRYGGHSRKGTDCSGLVMEVYAAVYGKKLTHNSADLHNKECRHIKERELREGDLVFFRFSKSGRINHVGIYLENGNFVHASSSRGVIISNLDEAYYRRGFVGAGRVL